MAPETSTGLVVERGGERQTIQARAVVLTSGGFEANLEWLKRIWGDAVDNYIIRGTPYNDGRVLAAMLDKGAATAGRPQGFSRGGPGCARAQVRWRNRHATGLRSVRHRHQQVWEALLR